MFSFHSPSLVSIRARSLQAYKEEGLHEELEERFCKTLYYGELPSEVDTPSMPLTDLAVEYFKRSTPPRLAHVDMHVASSLAHDAWISPGSVITSLIYAKRLRQRNQDYLQTMSSSDLFFISVMMASKYMYDEGIDEEVFNDEWAEAGNLETEEVNKLERDFLSAMDWQLFVSRAEFLKSVEEVQRRIAWTQGCTRGWLSYTDVDVLCNSELGMRIWAEIAVEWMKVITVSSAAYLVGLLTMLGSTALAIQMTTSMAGVAISSHQQPILPNPEVQYTVSSEPHFDQPMAALDTVNSANVNLDELVECNKSKPHMVTSDRRLQAVFSSPGHLDKILHQLWAVVAFKDKLIHLMCAFPEGLHHTRKVAPRFRTCTENNDHSHIASSDACKNSEKSIPVIAHGHLESRSKNVNFRDGDCRSAQGLKSYGYSYHQWNAVKSSIGVESEHCHGNRPPDVLSSLPYPDIIRGFTTGVPLTT